MGNVAARTGRRKPHTVFWWVNLKETECLGVDGSVILKWILKKKDRKIWSGKIWVRIGTSNGTF